MKKLWLLLLFLLPLFVIAQAPIKTVRLTADSAYLNKLQRSSSTRVLVIDNTTKKVGYSDSIHDSDTSTLWKASGTNAYYNRIGNIGIGKTNPVAKLQVETEENQTAIYAKTAAEAGSAVSGESTYEFGTAIVGKADSANATGAYFTSRDGTALMAGSANGTAADFYGPVYADSIAIRAPKTDTSTRVAVFDGNEILKYNWNMASKDWVRENVIQSITIVQNVTDTTGADPLCEGLMIYAVADSSTWQHAWHVDSITGDTTGCEWVDVTTAKWFANGTTLYYSGGPVMVNHSLYTSMIYPKPGTAAINLRAAGLEENPGDLAGVQVWGTDGGSVRTYANREIADVAYSVTSKLSPLDYYLLWMKGETTLRKVTIDTTAIFPETGDVDLGKSSKQWGGVYTKNIEVSDTSFAPNVTRTKRSMSSAADFTMAFIGDMHNVIPTNNWSIAANSVTRWLKAHKTSSNIVVIMAGGDISHDGTEWTQAMLGFDTIAASGLPYIASMGNHDYDDIATRDHSGWDTHFPVSRFSDQTWYGGAYQSSTSNMFIKFDVGSEKFLILSFEILPTDSTLTWADSVVTANSDRKVIVCTHYFLKYTGLRAISSYSNFSGLVGNNPVQVWDNFVKKHENIIMVINGHDIGGIGSAKLTSLGDSGNIVNQIYNNYQETTTGDMVTEIMLLTFSPSKGTIQTIAYAPLTNTIDTVGDYTLPYTPSLFDMDIKSTNNVLASGDISASGSISVNGGIQSSGDITTAGGIQAGKNINSDSTIRASVLEAVDGIYSYGNMSVSSDINAFADLNVSDNVTIEDTAHLHIIKIPQYNSLSIYGTTSPMLKLYTIGGNPAIRQYRFNGTLSSPTAVTANQSIMNLAGCGYNGSAETTNKATITGWAAEDWTTGANGTYLTLSTTPIGSTTIAERVRLTDVGYFGIGTTTPATDFEVNGTSTLPTILGGSAAGSGVTYQSTSGTGTAAGIAHQFKGGTAGGTTIMTMLNSGNVGIGNTAPTDGLTVGSASFGKNISLPNGNITLSSGGIDITRNSSSNTALVVTQNGTADIVNFKDGSNSVFNIKDGGNLGIGTTAPQRKFHVVGSSIHSDTLWVGSPTGTYSYCIPGGNWVTSSTREIKTNIADYPVSADILTKITGVNPKTWNFKAEVFRHNIKLSDFPDSIPNRKQKYREAVEADSLQAGEMSKRKHKGFIAEDISTITGKSSKEVDQGELIILLWQANQALIRKVEDLETRVAKLEKK